MPSTWTTNSQIEKPATGEQAGNWGVTANKSYDILDTAIDGNISIPISPSGFNLNINPGDPLSQGHNKVIAFTGPLTADATITITPQNAEKIYFITNSTSGGFNLNISQGSGGNYVLPMGYSAMVYTDGKGATAKVTGALANLHLNSLLIATSLIVQGQITWGGGAMTVSQPATFNAGVTISPSLILNFTGDQPYDMYYRSAATDGHTTRLANGSAGSVLLATATGPSWLPQGTAGQVLTAGAGGPSWMALPAQTPVTVGDAGSGGSGISGAVANPIFFGNPSLQLGQDFTLVWSPGYPGLGVGYGKPVDRQGLIVGRLVNSTIYIDSLAAGGRNIFFTTAGINRWGFIITSDGESGTNHGANLYINGYADSGGSAVAAVAFFRNGGRVTFGAVNDLGLAQVTILGVSPSQITLYVRAAPSQTAMLQQWLDGGGNVVASLDIHGHFTAAGGYT